MCWEELYCAASKNITQNSICELKVLKVLNCYNRGKIKNVNHLLDLRELYCCGSGIDQDGIKNLKKLVIIDFGRMCDITDLSRSSDTLKEINGIIIKK